MKNIILCSDFIYLINILSTRYFVLIDLSCIIENVNYLIDHLIGI